MGITKRCKLFALSLLLVIPLKSFGWGRDGHEMVAAIGSKLTFKGRLFWNSNLSNITKLSVIPDSLWKQGNTAQIETSTHFFQPDSYFSSPGDFPKIPHDVNVIIAKIGAKEFQERGSAIWRVNQFYVAALQALKNKNFKLAVEMAGVMSHYIGDLSQPLHVTENYDGQKTNNPGIHKFFESDNIKLNKLILIPAVGEGAQKLIANPDFKKQFNGDLVNVIFNEVYRAHNLKDVLIKTDLDFGRVGVGAQKQLVIARDRLADGSATLAIILSHMWEESGLKDAGATAAVQMPPWIPPNYYSLPIHLYLVAFEDAKLASSKNLLHDDHCYE